MTLTQLPTGTPPSRRRAQVPVTLASGVSFLNAQGIGPVFVFVCHPVRSFEKACGASVLRLDGAFCGVNIAINYLEVRQAPIAQQVRPRRFPVLVPNPKQRNAVVDFGALPQPSAALAAAPPLQAPEELGVAVRHVQNAHAITQAQCQLAFVLAPLSHRSTCQPKR